ncbi:MAG TPA: hypothetical protein DHV59_01555 [Oxalobacteraceae bacterium]|nr:hypothetical protein [Oxalobacteraceae bacterium]
MTIIQNSSADALVINEEHADRLEGHLYEIEALSVTMESVLESDLVPEYALRVISALRKELHRAFQDCISDLEKAEVLASARRVTTNTQEGGMQK